MPVAGFVPIDPVAEAAQQGAVHQFAEVALGGEVAAEGHRHPIDHEQQQGGHDLCAQVAVEQQQGGDKVAGGYRLQGVGVEVEVLRVEAQQVALHHHAQHPEDNEATEYLAVEGLVSALLREFGKGEGHGDPRHEEEERHHQVPEAEADPHFVVELIEDAIHPRQL